MSILRAPLSAPFDSQYMQLALEEASRAAEEGEVPVGAVAVFEDRVVGRGRNFKETRFDPTAHAEILALQQAGKVLGRWRLTGVTLYSTLEPCPMCAGALVMARADRLVYGATDPKAGAVGTLFDIARDPRLNHQLVVTAGIMADECSAILKAFFERLRNGP